MTDFRALAANIEYGKDWDQFMEDVLDLLTITTDAIEAMGAVSTSSHPLTTGAKTFVLVPDTRVFPVGEAFRAVAVDNGAASVRGTVTSSAPGTVTVNVTAVTGSGGPYDRWLFMLGIKGDKGDDGISGAQVADVQEGIFWNAGVAGGTANALTGTITPAPASWAAMTFLWIRVGAAANSSTTVTVNINSLGARNIVQADGTALAVGDMPANTQIMLWNDGTNCRLVAGRKPPDTIQIGDTIVTARSLPAPMLPSETVYLQSAYPALFALIGVLADPPTTWSSPSSGETGHFYAGFASATVAVFGGAGGILRTTTDGSTYTSRASQFAGSDIYGGCYGNATYLIVGSGGKISTSADGSTWTARTRAAASGFYGAVYDPVSGLFIAVGGSGEIETSPTGVTWTARASGYTGALLLAVATNGAGRTIAGYGNGNITYTDNGITWTYVASGPGGQINALAFIAGAWWALLSSGGVYRSTTGISGWTLVMTMPQICSAMTSAFGQTVLVGGNGMVQTTDDLINWTSRDASYSTSRVYAACALGGILLTAGEGGKVRTSTIVPYNTTTQFRTPRIPAPAGTRGYIKGA